MQSAPWHDGEYSFVPRPQQRGLALTKWERRYGVIVIGAGPAALHVRRAFGPFAPVWAAAAVLNILAFADAGA